MGEEFKDFTTTPTLTFGETPDTQELPSTVAEETELVADSAFNENDLTAEEKKEQQLLRQEFLAAIRENVRSQLDNIDILEHDGKIVNLGEKYDKNGKKGN